MKVQIALTIIILGATWGITTWMDTVWYPRQSTNLGVSQIKEDGSREKLRLMQNNGSLFVNSLWAASILIVAGMWAPSIIRPIRRWLEIRRVVGVFLFCALLFSVSGCRRPYDTPEFVEVKNNETAFVIPLEADTAAQVKFQSVESLQKLQVATKRIQITHRWVQTDYWGSWHGKYLPSITVIRVDRTPVTREWTADSQTGTTKRNEAIWVESSDSIGFSTGFTCTAYVQESEAAKFLYWYPSGSLATVMDMEIRGKIQSIVAEVAAKYKMDELRDRKNEIIKSVRDETSAFFAQRGITVQNVGMFGGFTYENPEIQKAIDNVFVAQQEKNVANALLAAQRDKNAKTISAAQADANAVVIMETGKANALKVQIAAAETSAKSTAYLEIKRLENQKSWIEKWDGKLPMHLWNTGSQSSSILVSPDSMDVKQK